MAKRLTDTEKWNDEWYISLSNDYKIVWQWLLDNCNHAGICKRSITLLNMMCKTDITEEQMLGQMGDRIIISGNDWFIPKFLKFQYTDLLSNRPVIVSVRKELIKKNYHILVPQSFGEEYIIIPESLDNDYSIIKDKSKDKDKATVKPKQQKNGKSESWFSGNYKAQGENLMAKRLHEGLEEANRKRKANS